MDRPRRPAARLNHIQYIYYMTDARASLLEDPPSASLYETFECRTRVAACLTTLQVGATKIFLAGVGWQAAAFASRQSSTSLGFWAAAGAGDAGGTFLGNAVLLSGLAYWQGWQSCMHVVQSGVIVSTGSLLSGSIWQPLVNHFHSAGLSFSVGMVLVGMACGACFLIGITVAALCFSRCSRSKRDFAKDFSLSLSVAGATATFVGTDESWHGNWLQQLVGERNGASVVRDCLTAGVSVVLGFCVLQLVLIAFVPPRIMWTTPDSIDERAGGAGANRPPTRSLALTDARGTVASATSQHDDRSSSSLAISHNNE